MNVKSNKLIDFVSDSKVFIIVYFIFIILVSFLIAYWGKINVHLYINQHFTSLFADLFFKYATFLGDGIFAALFLIVLLLKDKKWVLEFGIAWLLLTIIVQLMKRVIFKDIDRPGAIIGYENLHLVEGVKLHLHNSFPSGHTATAFAIFLFLTMKIKSVFWQLVFAILAITVAFSRVYLSQHFVTDVLFGSIIGFLSTFFAVYLIERKINNKDEG